ncbi:MAG: MDR family MFS transporter [Dehalococcoidales bacterium]|nr:MDR family MFS transporter [Dehalococcoidales bacterium]
MEKAADPTYQSNLPRRQVMTALIGTMFTMFLGSIFMTVTSTAMPRIVADLSGFSQYTWVQTAYIITESISLPLAGKLSDMYGRKGVLVIGMSIFVLGTLLSGFSQTMLQLIIFRGVQGFGFGAMSALGFIIVADLFPPQERGKYMGVMAGVFGVSTVIGPTLGGIITDALSWRWCFFLTTPLGIAIIFIFIFLFPTIKPTMEKRPIDYLGIILLTLFIVPLILGLNWAGSEYPWGSPVIIGLFIFSAVMLVVFINVERRAAEPIIPMSLFKNRMVSVSSIVVFLQGASFFPVMTFVPLFFQGVLGASATESGGFMTPMMLGMAFGSFLGGQILSRTGHHFRLQGTIAFGIACTGFFLLSGMSPTTTMMIATVYLVITGFGNGNLMPVHTIAVQNNVPYSQLGTSTSLIALLRPLGGVVGLALMGSILNHRFASSFTANISPEVTAAVSPETISGIMNNPQAIIDPTAYDNMRGVFENMGGNGLTLFDQLITTLREALSSALTQIFLIFFIICVLAMVANFFLKKNSPKVDKTPASSDKKS